jgi:hypothetical protein
MTTEYLGGSADAGRAAPDAMPAARTTPKRAPTSRLSSGLRATDVEDGATAGCARTTSRLARISRRFQCRHYGIGAASAALWSSSPHPGVSAKSRQRGVLGGVSLVPGAPCEQNPHKGGRKFSARAKSVEWRQAAGRDPYWGEAAGARPPSDRRSPPERRSVQTSGSCATRRSTPLRLSGARRLKALTMAWSMPKSMRSAS